MKHVPQPVRLVLRELDVEAVERAWEGIRAKRSRRRAIPLLLAAALVTSALLAALAFWARPSGAGPLRDPNGIASAFTGGDAGGTARLSDDSVITLGKGAQVRVLENTDTAFTMVLTCGAAVFDVKPGGPRRWRVELGCGAVEVVGTRFSIDRGEARVIVRVERGAVLVRSDQLQPDHVERLEAGAREARSCSCSAGLRAPRRHRGARASGVPPPRPRGFARGVGEDISERGRRALCARGRAPRVRAQRRGGSGSPRRRRRAPVGPPRPDRRVHPREARAQRARPRERRGQRLRACDRARVARGVARGRERTANRSARTRGPARGGDHRRG